MGEMTIEIEDLTLVQKLAKIRAISDVVYKEKKGYNYTYASITTILANITAGMKKYRVSLHPCIVPNTAETRQVISENTKFTKDGKQYINKTTEMMVTAEMVFKWVNDDDPSDSISIPWLLIGSQSDPAQAMGSGLTYTMRQFLTTFFQIAQEDTDVDAFRSKQKAAESLETKAIVEGIIREIDVTIKTFISDNPDRGDEVKKFVSRYIKSADYSKIKEPAIAAKLLEDFKNKFVTVENENADET